MRKTVEAPALLLDLLARLFPDSSRTTLRQMLATGRVRVNGAIEKSARRELERGDVIDVASRTSHPLLPPSLALLHEDDHLLVVLKEAGLLTVATESEQTDTAQAHLNAYLKKKGSGQRIHVVHRLDRDTSGVLVFPKDFETKEKLKEAFSEHDIDRVYAAVVEGRVERARGTIRSHLVEDERTYMVRSIDDPRRGRLAVTHFRTIEAGEAYSLLEVTLETGRKNQIRVHLSEAGHPVVGDARYGAQGDPLGRLGLHAELLGFVHPWTGKKMTFRAPVPDGFRKLTT